MRSRYVNLYFYGWVGADDGSQAKVLRDQKSWSGRSAIERLFWAIDSSIELVSRSTDWVARD